MILQCLGALIAVMACAIILEAPKKFLIHAGIVGAIGWCLYLMIVGYLDAVKATFIAGLAIASLSHLFARQMKAPVTIFLIPGFFPLVPGAGMYRTVYYFLRNQRNLFEYNLNTTIQIAGMIAVSIFAIDAISKINKKKHTKS